MCGFFFSNSNLLFCYQFSNSLIPTTYPTIEFNSDTEYRQRLRAQSHNPAPSLNASHKEVPRPPSFYWTDYKSGVSRILAKVWQFTRMTQTQQNALLMITSSLERIQLRDSQMGDAYGVGYRERHGEELPGLLWTCHSPPRRCVHQPRSSSQTLFWVFCSEFFVEVS